MLNENVKSDDMSEAPIIVEINGTCAGHTNIDWSKVEGEYKLCLICAALPYLEYVERHPDWVLSKGTYIHFTQNNMMKRMLANCFADIVGTFPGAFRVYVSGNDTAFRIIIDAQWDLYSDCRSQIPVGICARCCRYYLMSIEHPCVTCGNCARQTEVRNLLECMWHVGVLRPPLDVVNYVRDYNNHQKPQLVFHVMVMLHFEWHNYGYFDGISGYKVEQPGGEQSPGDECHEIYMPHDISPTMSYDDYCRSSAEKKLPRELYGILFSRAGFVKYMQCVMLDCEKTHVAGNEIKCCQSSKRRATHYSPYLRANGKVYIQGPFPVISSVPTDNSHKPVMITTCRKCGIIREACNEEGNMCKPTCPVAGNKSELTAVEWYLSVVSYHGLGLEKLPLSFGRLLETLEQQETPWN